MHGLEVADPYVERLLEGVGFLAARVQLKLDAEFPRFTQALLEIVYPHYLAPTPSMLVAQLKPDPNDPNLAAGPTVPRGSALSGVLAADDATACEFRTAHDVTLWPVEIVSASYFSFAPDLPLNALPVAQRIKGGVRIRLKTTAGLKFAQTAIDRLCFYLAGRDDVANKLYELCLATGLGVLVLPAKSAKRVARVSSGGVDPAGRLRRRRGAAAGDAALVSGLPAAAGVFFVSAALPVFRADGAGAGAQAGRRRPGRARDSARPRRADARERRRRLEPGAVLHAGHQSVPQARRSHSRQRQRARVSRRRRPDQAARFRDLRGDRASSATASAPTANSSSCRSTRRTAATRSISSPPTSRRAASRGWSREPRSAAARARATSAPKSSSRWSIRRRRRSAATCASSRFRRCARIAISCCRCRSGVGATDLSLDVAAPVARHPRDQRSEPSVRAAGRRRRVLARDQPPVAQLSVARAIDAGGRGRGAARSARALRGERRRERQEADRGHPVGARGPRRAPAARRRVRSPSAAASRSPCTSTSWRSRAPARSCSDRCSIDISRVTSRSTRSPKPCCGRRTAGKSTDGGHHGARDRRSSVLRGPGGRRRTATTSTRRCGGWSACTTGSRAGDRRSVRSTSPCGSGRIPTCRLRRRRWRRSRPTAAGRRGSR